MANALEALGLESHDVRRAASDAGAATRSIQVMTQYARLCRPQGSRAVLSTGVVAPDVPAAACCSADSSAGFLFPTSLSVAVTAAPSPPAVPTGASGRKHP